MLKVSCGGGSLVMGPRCVRAGHRAGESLDAPWTRDGPYTGITIPMSLSKKRVIRVVSVCLVYL